MKVTLHLTKAELDLIEEAVLQYQNLLLNAKSQGPMVENELRLCRRVVEELGIDEEIDEEVVAPQDPMNTLPNIPGAPNHYPFSR